MAKTPKTKPAVSFPRFMSKRAIIGSCLGLIAVLAIICVSLASYTVRYKNRIYPHTTIGPVDFGGKTKQEAQDLLRQTLATDTTITLKTTEKTITTIPLAESGFQYDTDKTVEQLLGVGREGSLTLNLQELWRSLAGTNKRLAAYTVDQDLLDKKISAVIKKTSQPAEDAQIILTKDNQVEMKPETIGHGFAATELKDIMVTSLANLTWTLSLEEKTLIPQVTQAQAASALDQTKRIIAATPLTLVVDETHIAITAPEVFAWITFQPEGSAAATSPPLSFMVPVRAQTNQRLVAVFDTAKVTAFLTDLSGTINRDAQNAELTVDNGAIKVAKAETDGKKLKTDEAVKTVIQQLTNIPADFTKTITLPVETTQATIRTNNITELGIKDLVGHAQTDFRGSPSNRVHNITTGANFLHGEIVAPGQEFSTVKTLGSVDGATGYLPELVIKDNKTTPEFGGGLCQVSTTLFRAVLNAGLKVTERQNHSYRVSYYEPPVGLDATIYLPKPDFRFLNTTDHYLLIQNKIEGTKITFDIYGTSDGRKSTISDPVVSDITDPPAPIYADTDTLNKGETKQIEKPHQGATAVATYTVFDKDGKEINKQIFKSKYKAWPARFLVGTKEP